MWMIMKIRNWLQERRREPDLILPWIFLVSIFFALQKGQALYTAYLLFLMAVFALYDIVHSRSEGAILFYWCGYTAAAAALFVWKSCVCSEWMLAVLFGGMICALLFLMRWIWRNMI